MSVSTIVRSLVDRAVQNSPVLLTSLGVAGVVSTTVLAAKAGSKASRLLKAVEDEAYERLQDAAEELTARDKVALTWPYFVPTAVMGAVTIACVVGAHRVTSNRYAALVGAYTMTEKALQKYEEKVLEVLGEKKVEKVRDAVAQDAVANNPPSKSSVIITGKGDVLCYDSLTGRYFESNVEALRKAQNDMNARVINNMYASQNEFYALIDLPPAQIGEELGWRDNHLMELSFSSTLAEDSRPCLVIDYYPKPVLGYYKEH